MSTVNQNIAQLRSINVNTLNNVGVIGSGFGLLSIDVNPSQWAATHAKVSNEMRQAPWKPLRFPRPLRMQRQCLGGKTRGLY
ncbi:hypothetical protein ACU4GD_32690 [Cupriavidus basilensis]